MGRSYIHDVAVTPLDEELQAQSFLGAISPVKAHGETPGWLVGFYKGWNTNQLYNYIGIIEKAITRWCFLIFFWNFHPDPWGFMIQLDEHIFQMGCSTTN